MPPSTVSKDMDLEKQDRVVSGDSKADIGAPAASSTSEVIGGDFESNTPLAENESTLNIPPPGHHLGDVLNGDNHMDFKGYSPWQARRRTVEALANGHVLEHLHINERDSDYATILESYSMPCTVNSTRLITADLQYRFEGRSRLIDALDKSLQVEPAFWLACATKFGDDRCAIEDGLNFDFRPLEPSFCVIGPYVVKTWQNMAANGALTNMILIVSHITWSHEHGSSSFLYNYFENGKGPGNLPILLAHEERMTLSEARPKIERYKVKNDISWSSAYLGLLRSKIQAGSLEELVKQPFKLLYPLMELQIWAMRATTRYNRASYLPSIYLWEQPPKRRAFDSIEKPDSTSCQQVLSPETCRIFRRRIEDFVDSNDQFIRFVSNFDTYDALNDNDMRKLTRDSKHVLEEARRLDLEIRDFIHLNVSHASLKESRKSIELADIQSERAIAQLEESKRGILVHQVQDLAIFADVDIVKIGVSSSKHNILSPKILMLIDRSHHIGIRVRSS